MIRRIGIAMALVAVALAGCTDDGFDGDAVAVICTNFGPITIELFSEHAPITSQNFLDLADRGDYDGVAFHRIISGFMMQGGDTTNGDGTGGDSFQGGTIPDEFHPSLRHDKAGILSMANRGPNTGSSQFFITFGPTSWLDDKHTVFGQVTAGMDVVQAIESDAGSQGGTPRTDVAMITVLAGTTDASQCPEEQELEPAHVDIDVITPGTFHVTNAQDRVLVWARSTGDKGSLTWSLTGTEGTMLPDGWTASFPDAPTKVAAGKLARTVMELSVPEGTTGSHELELHIGASSQPITVNVALDGERVSGPGDRVEVQYRGTCTAGGEEFDSGSFPTTLGSGQTVPGFDFGLMGLSLGEEASLVLPGELAYGTSGSRTGCSGGELTFEVSILAFQ